MLSAIGGKSSVQDIENMPMVAVTAPAARGPALLLDLLTALLPPGTDMAVAWCDPRLDNGRVATPGAGDHLHLRASVTLAGVHPDALLHPFDIFWDEAGTRVAVAVDPPCLADDDDLERWVRPARAALALVAGAELARAQIRTLRKSERLQQALYEIADLASSSLEMRDMLARIHVLVASLMSAENFYIALHDDVNATMRFLYFADQNDPWQPDPDAEIPLAEVPNSLTAALMRHGQPVMGPSDHVRAQLGIARDDHQGPESADWLGVPVRRDARIAGAIVVQSYDRPDSYSHEDRALLEYVAQHILTALDRKHAQHELERRVDQRTMELQRANAVLQAQIVERQRAERLQRALFRISEMSVSAGSLLRFYADVHEVVNGLVYAENFYIAMLVGDGERIEFPYSVDERDPVRPPRRLSNGLTEFVIRSGQPMLADRATIDRLQASGDVHSQGTRAHCWLGVPLSRDETVIGAIAVQSYSPHILFDERDQELLTLRGPPYRQRVVAQARAGIAQGRACRARIAGAGAYPRAAGGQPRAAGAGRRTHPRRAAADPPGTP